jgi:hypothetical protein
MPQLSSARLPELAEKSATGAGNACPEVKVASDASDIAFLQYRLDVLNNWPPSDHKTSLIAATCQRLRNYGVTADI